MLHAVDPALASAPPEFLQRCRDAPLVGGSEFWCVNVKCVPCNLQDCYGLLAGERPFGNGVLPSVIFVSGRLLRADVLGFEVSSRPATLRPAGTDAPPRRKAGPGRVPAWRCRSVQPSPARTGALRFRRGDTPFDWLCREKHIAAVPEPRAGPYFGVKHSSWRVMNDFSSSASAFAHSGQLSDFNQPFSPQVLRQADCIGADIRE